MSANPLATRPAPASEPAAEGWPPYPEYGTDEDALARMKLLEWIWQQVSEGQVKVEPGDHVLATDGRIVGVGRDRDEVLRRVLEAEPALRNARLVAYDVPPPGY
jgi:hypothetical protein